MCKLSVSGTTCAPPARRKGVTPGKSPGHNDEGIDEQGTESGSIPDAGIVLDLVMGREKVRSIRTPAVLSSLWRVQAYCSAGRRNFNPPDNVFLRVNTCLHAWR